MEPAKESAREVTQRRTFDGLLVSEQEVWVVVGDEDDATVLDWLREADTAGPLMVCRGFSDEGHVRIGAADPGQDRWLSDFFSGTDRGRA